VWDHLSVNERSRRVAILELGAVTGGLSCEYYTPHEILDLWAFHNGDPAQALSYREPSQSELDDFYSGELIADLMTPPDSLLKLWSMQDYEGVAEHPLLPPEAFHSVPQLHEASGCVGLTNDSGNHLLPMIARNSAIDEETYEWLCLQVSDEVHGIFDWIDLATALIGNPATSTEHLQAVTPLDEEWLRVFSASADDSYIRDYDIALNVAYASHPGLPLQNLVALAQDINPEVRSAVAANMRTPIEVLETLAMDASQEVRSAVKTNPQATDEIKALTVLSY